MGQRPASPPRTFIASDHSKSRLLILDDDNFGGNAERKGIQHARQQSIEGRQWKSHSPRPALQCASFEPACTRTIRLACTLRTPAGRAELLSTLLDNFERNIRDQLAYPGPTQFGSCKIYIRLHS